MIDELRELDRLASPAPWDLGRHEGDAAAFVSECAGKSDRREVWMAILPGHDPDDSPIPAITGNGPTSEANARLIVGARNSLPHLIAHIDAQAERIAALEAAGDLLRRELIVLANTEARKAATDYAVEAWDAALGA